jgi:signal transduction histidine kinase
MTDALSSLWDEPAVANPPRRVWRDWVLVGAMTFTAVVEGALRPDVTWRPVAVLVCVALGFGLLWRRTHPLAVVLVVFGVLLVVDVASVAAPGPPFGLYTMAYVLVLPYSLCRWGSGRDIILGLSFAIGTHIVRELVHANLRDLAFGIPILLLAAAVGLVVRYRGSVRSRERERVTMLEREQLARELHDTVAHHVSAIAIQAQAGGIVATSDPDAALQALRSIEGEATRALAEMRMMVSTLRGDEAAQLAPQRSIGDITQLARSEGEPPAIEVDLIGDVDDLRPAVGAALYRLAQESITNALRHARNATRIAVRVVGDDDRVTLTVVDDGEVAPAGRSPRGYGLVGMAERTTLLGGTFAAGPGAHGGWTVTAALPRETVGS